MVSCLQVAISGSENILPGAAGDTGEPASELSEPKGRRAWGLMPFCLSSRFSAASRGKSSLDLILKSHRKSHFFREAPLDSSVVHAVCPPCLIALTTVFVRIHGRHCCDFMLLFPAGLTLYKDKVMAPFAHCST